MQAVDVTLDDASSCVVENAHITISVRAGVPAKLSGQHQLALYCFCFECLIKPCKAAVALHEAACLLKRSGHPVISKHLLL